MRESPGSRNGPAAVRGCDRAFTLAFAVVVAGNERVLARIQSVLLLAWVLGVGGSAWAGDPIGVGDSMAPAELNDQHGKPHGIDSDVQVLLFSRDMDGGAVIRGVLDEDPEFLARNRAVYVSDVSGMPRFVLNAIAKPKMRGRPYPVLLDETGEVTAGLPNEKGKPTVIWLEAGTVRRIAEPATPEDLRGLFAPGDGSAAAD